MEPAEQLNEDRGLRQLESRAPGTGELLGLVEIHGEREVAAAVQRARRAARCWSALSHQRRRAHLLAWRREIARRTEELAELLQRENGKPHLDALQEVLLALSHLSYAAAHAERALRARTVSSGLLANFRARVSYHPLGVVGVIGPWNYPVFTPMGSIAFALAAGNTVVFKPSELTPLVGKLLVETARDAIPVADVVQVVTGDGSTGAALARAEVDKIAFTGSSATGRKVMAAAAERLTPVLMELGGKDAMIVAEDADVERAADSAVFGALTNAGQTCISIERAYVVDQVYDRFVGRVVDKAKDVRATAGGDTELGAMTRPEQLAVIREHIDDAIAKGARALVGGPQAVGERCVQPTVLVDLSEEMKVMREETFGPVLPIVRVADVDEAVRRANDTPYGLGSAVWARRAARQIADRIRAGSTAINGVLVFTSIPALPFGGVGASGFGRIHGEEGLREMSRIKSTAEERVRLPVNLLSFDVPKNAAGIVRTLIRQVYGGGIVDRVASKLGR